MSTSVVVGRTHRPCGSCGTLVDLTDGCEHVGRTPRAARRVRQQQAAMVARAGLLAALGYPRPE